MGAVYQRFVRVSQLLRQPHRQNPPSRVAAALMPFFTYLDRCTSPADRLVATGELPAVIVLAGRGFASDGVVFGAWYSSAAHQDRTLERLRARPALFVIAMDEANFRKRFSLIARYVDEEYTPFADVPGKGVRVPILVHRHRASLRADADTGWPCFQ